MSKFRAALAILVSALIWMPMASPANAGDFTSRCYGKKCEIIFKGEIVSGDNDTLVKQIKKSPLAVTTLELDSPGGNPFEALLMSDTLNKYFITALTGDKPDCSGHTCPDGVSVAFNCASACAIMFITADNRLGKNVFLHRPTFPSELFSRLNGRDGEIAYNNTVDRLIAELKLRHVSDSDIQVMMNVPSEQVIKLRENYPSESPWLAEWLRAKCGPDPMNALTRFSTDEELSKLLPAGTRWVFCKGDAHYNEASIAQQQLKIAQSVNAH